MNYLNKFYPESRFGDFSDIDGTIAFYNRVNALLKNNFTVLNIGCGRGSFLEDKIKFRQNLQRIKGKAKKIIGIDIDSNAESNPDLDDFKLIIDGHFPIKNNSIDLCISDFVLEHVENPTLFFSECQRVLKKGGYLCIRTTNRWGYIGFAAKFFSQKKHAVLLKRLQEHRLEKDVFPKFYRVNSLYRIKKMLKSNGFDYYVYGISAEPSYFAFSKQLYKAVTILHRLTPNFFKVAIFAFAKKK